MSNNRNKLISFGIAMTVSRHGSITGYFVAWDEDEEFWRFKQGRRSSATAELSDDRVGMRISMPRLSRKRVRANDRYLVIPTRKPQCPLRVPDPTHGTICQPLPAAI
jgi:hypothetical protein